MSKKPRLRLDNELVAQGLFPTQEAAARAVMAGDVSTSNRRLEHPGEQVRAGIELHVREQARYVSRGGLKLAYALDQFKLDVTGLNCIDIGCSTGGFTDCLLQRGAAQLTSVDVGYAQFSYRLRNDPRVTLLERTNIRDLDIAGFHGSFDLAVCDVSFVSLRSLLGVIARLLCDTGRLVALVKPQFELPADCVGEGGVVHRSSDRARALTCVIDAANALGLAAQALCPSPITGAKGNHEYLLLAQHSAQAQDIDVAAAVGE